VKRDDFTRSTLRTLADRAGHRCSNPKCGRATTGARSDGGVLKGGIGAHICAAAEGGERYDPTMSKDERRSADNGIWLCDWCSRMIDQDPSGYSVELLQSWKRQAEQTARQNIGQKLYNDAEATDMLIGATTGTTKRLLPNMIHNVHNAVKQQLEALDPRFAVSTSLSNNALSYHISPKEAVSLELHLFGDRAQANAAGYRALVEHGRDFSVDGRSMAIKGSPLFDELVNGVDGTLLLSSPKLKAIQKIWLVEKGSGLVRGLNEVHGELSIGTKSMSFIGSAHKGLITTTFSIPITTLGASVPINAKFNVTLNTDLWTGMDIRGLPHLEKLLSFYASLVEGWDLCAAMEVDGREVFTSASMNVESVGHMKGITTFLYYTHRCSELAKAFNWEARFTENVVFSQEEHKRVHEASIIAAGDWLLSESDLTKYPSFIMEVLDDLSNYHAVADLKKPTNFLVEDNEGNNIVVFGETRELPPVTTDIECVLPKVLASPEQIGPGSEVVVELRPAEGFCVRKRFAR